MKVSKKIVRKLIWFIVIFIITFSFFKFRLQNVIFVYPESVAVEYTIIADLKEEKGLGFKFFVPQSFVFGKEKNNLIAYRTENNNIIFVIEKNRPDLFTVKLADKYKDDYEFYTRLLTNKWNVGYFMLKYLMISEWEKIEIKKIEINNFKGFLFSGKKIDQNGDYHNYLYELFDKNYRLTIAVRVNKREFFNEGEINYLISKFEPSETNNRIINNRGQ